MAGGAGADWSDADRPDVAWAQASAPDDISELARDIHAYHREQRAARRRQRFGRLAFGPTAAPLTLTVAALAVVAVVATLLTVMGPRSAGSPPPLPLATTTVHDGVTGGLLPDVNLTDANGTTLAARSLRPAVIAVLPPGCGCGDDVRVAAANASKRSIPLYAVVPAGQSADGDSLAGQLQRTAILSDTTGDLESAVIPTGLTLVLVDSHGAIYQVEKSADAVDTAALPAHLLQMLASTG